MRLLHTADWHLGRAFHGAGLLDAQAAWVDWLVDTARRTRPDAVLVAGDLYDRALPPVDAVRLADEALSRLAELAPVVVISGNHDSAARLRFGATLLRGAGLHLRADALDCGTPVRVGGGLVYAIPYLEPDVARVGLGCAGRGHTAVLEAAMDRVRGDLAHRPHGAPSAVVAHAFVGGGEPSDSERDLAIGGAAAVAPSTFAGVDYVALGHLHGPQRVGDVGRYAGSPLAFSFSEATHAKSVALVDVGPVNGVELLRSPVARALARLRGGLEELLADSRHAAAEGSWVEATLTDAARPAEAMERLRRRFPHAVSLRFEPEGALAAREGSYAARLRGLGDLELARCFVEDVRGVEADSAERRLLAEALGSDLVAEEVTT